MSLLYPKNKENSRRYYSGRLRGGGILISLILTQLKTHKNSVLKWLFHRYIGANYRYRIWTNFEKKVVHTLVSTRITNILGVGNKRPKRLFRFPIKINNEVDKKQYFDVIMVFVYQVPTFSQNIYRSLSVHIMVTKFWVAPPGKNDKSSPPSP